MNTAPRFHTCTTSLLPQLFAGLFTILAQSPTSGAFAAEAPKAPREIFEQRIRPIFKSPNPSSCTECHLAGVDLKNYILPSHEKTSLSLRDQGLIDFDNPADSKFLRLIAMGADNKQGASLISASVRETEYAAFAEWIKASARDSKLRDAAKLLVTEVAKPTRPNEVIRHARTDRLLASFEQNIWSQRFRCSGCHSPNGSENAKLVAEHGEQVSWLKDTADATMRALLESENVNVTKPERSGLLLKPLNEIKHGGGQKMLPGDMTYKAFRAWLDDYAKTVNDRYAKSADLPKPKSGPAMIDSEIWLKLNNTPPMKMVGHVIRPAPDSMVSLMSAAAESSSRRKVKFMWSLLIGTVGLSNVEGRAGFPPGSNATPFGSPFLPEPAPGHGVTAR